jgi:predicted metal-dependent hydrolase
MKQFTQAFNLGGFMKKNRVGRKNLEMNGHVFALRRKVIALVYEANRLVPNLPRVEVRIVENEGNTLGVASLKTKHISIMANCVADNDEILRHVVFHELVHTLFGVRHDETCPLMKALVSIPCSKQEAHAIFKQYAKGA